MSTDIMNDRLTIKNMIFTKALPNYKIPVPTDGYKIFPCTDCGDKFLFESSYDYHINRKSLKISYFCRHCMEIIVFYNRCKLLFHIRSHAFKSATITVTDLKIEPLPLENFNLSILGRHSNQATENQTNPHQVNVCYECNVFINQQGIAYVDRAAHYMQCKNEVNTCPICMFLFPTACALEAHLRLHLHIPPFICPECGMNLPNKFASYPYDHDCASFKMMKASTRIKCKLDNCKIIFHPDEYIRHYTSHLKKVYRCSYCLEMWFNKTTKCTKCDNGIINHYIQCPLCPRKIIINTLIERHLNSHSIKLREKLFDQIYPCTTCNLVYQHMCTLITHLINKHTSPNLKKVLSKISLKTVSEKSKGRQKNVYHRVIKKCTKCLRSFTYRCLYENIMTLPNECPYRCSTNDNAQDHSQSNEENNNLQIDCPLCKTKISEKWANIKTHYAEFHKNHKCLDIKVLVEKLDIKLSLKKSKKGNSKCSTAIAKKRLKKNKMQADKMALINKKKDRNNELKEIPKNTYVCIICNCNCENTQHLETHLITHRDPCMAYQCLECGQCFVVKPSFSTHLLLEHGIPDVQEYIDKKPCYNEKALLKHHNDLNSPNDEPVKENQCKICREQFENSNNLEKHFRVHGMAFLMKNSHKNNSP